MFVLVDFLKFVQIELKVKAAEARFEEEKLKIQKDHEELIKQVYYKSMYMYAFSSCQQRYCIVGSFQGKIFENSQKKKIL